MAQKYTQKANINGEWVEQYPKTSADQVVTDENRQFLTAAEKAAYAAKQEALGFTPEDSGKKNQPGGYAGLGEDGRLSLDLMPETLQHDLGHYADKESLLAAHPTAKAGDFAVVESTDTIWIWDADASPAQWIDTANRVTVPDGSTSQKGIVQLSSATDSAAEDAAATPKAVKAAMDAAVSKAKITVGETAPANPAEGDFWFDTSAAE